MCPNNERLLSKASGAAWCACRAWAAGVGYGSGSHGALSEVWNAKKSQAAQAAQDLELQRLFLRLADSLRGVLDARAPPPPPACTLLQPSFVT